MSSPAYEDAKRILAASLSSYFPDGEQRGVDYYWRRRPEDKTPSCHMVPDTYQVKDFGDPDYRGSVIDAYAESQGLTPEQAVEKVRGKPVREPRGRREKAKPMLPVPQAALKALNPVMKSDWAIEHHGTPTKGWTYHDAQGRPEFCVVRYERDGAKDIIPYYYGVDERWHEGQARKDGRPLYSLHKIIKSTAPVLVVEGEKCAEVAVEGYVVTTWAGGSGGVTKADWAVLQKREVLIWPDADEPGLKAARAIQRRLPQARILEVSGRPQGWDIADAVAEGINPAAFIAECGIREVSDDLRGAPFVALGFNDHQHWYLIKGQRVPMAVPRGSWTQSKILELAPLAFWSMSDMITDNGSIRVATAQDFLNNVSAQAGRYWPDLLRGAGVWREPDGRIVINDGQHIILPDGSAVSYDDYRSNSHYLSADVRFGDLSGEPAKAYEGQRLLELFDAQQWASGAHAVIAMGWSLLAPFGGILHWRPHIWISGRKGSGKSWVLENLIRELCGPFAYVGTGEDSGAGIRRSLRTDARPVILDEMEPGDKRSQDKVTAILRLARNASSDSSEYITIAAPDGGTLQFRIRACFCFASVNILHKGAAMESRIMRLEMQPMTPEEEKIKAKRSLEYGDVRADMARFLRRTFHALPRILDDITYLHRSLTGQLGDMRQIDQIAPVLAAAWAAQSDESISCAAGGEWLDKQFVGLMSLAEDTVEDEDRLIEHILGAQVLTDDRQSRSIGELLRVADGFNCPPDVTELLERTGLRLMRNGNDSILAISSRSDQLARILSGTPYEHGYDAQLRRNSLCTSAGIGRQVRIAGVNTRCRCLDWEGFKAKYMGEGDTDQPDLWEGLET